MNSPDAAFEARAPAQGGVILEIPLAGSSPAPLSILQTLEKRNIHATLLVSKDWAQRHASFLRSAAEAGHEVGFWYSLQKDLGLTSDMTSDPVLSDWVESMRTGRKVLRKITRSRIDTIAVSFLPITGEVAAEGLAFRAILISERTIDDIPRRSRSFAGSVGRSRIIGQGPYLDGCGDQLPHWSPAALDRATGAVARGEWVRIALPSNAEAGDLLGRWLDEVVIPEKWNIKTASKLANKARKMAEIVPVHQPENEVAVARAVPIDTWMEIAETISSSNPLPRYPSEGINLTESFIGLVSILAADTPPGSISLGPLEPPMEVAAYGLSGPKLLSEDDVKKSATLLSKQLRGRIPSLIGVGDATLTAAEALQVIAKTILGHPPEATPVTDPDPYAPGGGWGSSKGL
jgi:peptidoglycan/xylan/chitin deacetylase (PgdA/CDA1 family)